MLNYMLLTVVANGHNCVATATAGYAQERCQDFTLVATEAECQSIFRKKVDDLFSRRLQNITVLNKAGPTSQQSQFSVKNPLNRRLEDMAPLIPFWLRPWQRNAIRCVHCHTATQCV